MNSDQQQSERSTSILVIDHDPIFRLGLSSALEEYGDFQVIAQTDTAAAALAILEQQFSDLIVLAGVGGTLVLEELAQLVDEHPQLPVFLLSTTPNPQQLRIVQTLGIRGYCPKGISVDELVSALRQVASGDTYWQISALAAAYPLQPLRQPKQTWLISTGQSGLQQISRSLSEIEHHLHNAQLSLVDWLFWSGRKRELLAARWVVSQLLPVELEETPGLVPVVPAAAELTTQNTSGRGSGGFKIETESAFNHTLEKIQSDIQNLTGVPLEIDILQHQKKQELLYLIVNQLQENLAELRFLQVTPEQLPERVPLILRELWQTATINFLSKNCPSLAAGNRLNLTEILLREAVLIQQELLDKIPWITELMAYFLFQESLRVNDVSYRHGSPEANERAELIVENFVIHVADAVMQVILNYFFEAEDVQNLYKEQLVSSREIAKFRNNLSWRYRQEKYFAAPTDIFESKYRLFYFSDRGIKTTFVYASRQNELNQLQGIPWIVTMALEARDALAPRLQAVVDFVGRGLIYVLTEVIGKGIGLVGRGVILGIGNVLQETRYRKNSERGKQ
ncbi:MAG: DUF3685 domain-containing protein [Cyanophyceae cyanobacterium]